MVTRKVKYLINYFQIVLKSVNKTKYRLSLLKDAVLYGKSTLNNLLEEVTQMINIIGSSVLTLKGKQK